MQKWVSVYYYKSLNFENHARINCCCYFWLAYAYAYAFFWCLLFFIYICWNMKKKTTSYSIHTHTQHALNIYGAEKIKKYIRWWGRKGRGFEALEAGIKRRDIFGKRLKPSHMFLSFFMLHKAIINKQMVGSGNVGGGGELENRKNGSREG